MTVDGDAAVDVPAGADWPVSGVIRLRASEATNPVALSALLSALGQRRTTVWRGRFMDGRGWRSA